MIKALFVVFMSVNVFAADYLCETEFGELVPVRKKVYVNKSQTNRIESEIEYPSSKSKDFHKHLNSKVKTKKFIFNENSPTQKTVQLDTGYTKIKGSSFSLRLICADTSKCNAHFLDSGKIISAPKHRIEIHAPKIFDLRYPDNRGHATIEITRRGPPNDKKVGFLARVYKEKAFKTSEENFIGTSASGEIKFSGEPDFISFDAGADEQLELFNGQYQRIATLEFKVECYKQ